MTGGSKTESTGACERGTSKNLEGSLGRSHKLLSRVFMEFEQ